MINKAVDLARKAQVEWVKVPVRERAAIFRKFSKLVLERQAEIMDVLQEETHKNRLSAFEEVLDTVQLTHYYGRHAAKFLKDQKRAGAFPIITKTREVHRPIGVVGVITPWNYPFTLPSTDVAPAVIAGNTVVLLPDELTPKCADLMLSLMREAGLPDGVVTIVHGGGRVHGSDLINAADFIMFTGSTATGRIVAKQCAERLIGFSGELGGKNPMIVLDGANVKRAAEIAIAGAFGSAGQLCVSIERVYVPNRIKDEFLAEIAKRTQSLTVGRSNDFTMDIGSLTGYNQLQRVMGFVDDAVSTGAKVVAGGQQLTEAGPYFFTPTVITNVNQNARMYRQEVFGPVVDVEGYEDLDEAIRLANDTDYGLNASVVGPERAAIKVAEKLNAGSVNINEGFRASFASMESPMGGVKASGQGRRNGPGGLLRFTEAKSIGVARGLIKLPSRAKDYNRMAPLMRIMLKRLK